MWFLRDLQPILVRRVNIRTKTLNWCRHLSPPPIVFQLPKHIRHILRRDMMRSTYRRYPHPNPSLRTRSDQPTSRDVHTPPNENHSKQFYGLSGDIGKLDCS